MASLALGAKFVPASNGTGDFVYSATIQGYRSPTSALTDGKTYRYRAESSDMSEWEYGAGVWSSSTSTLTRATVAFSSTGAKISFTLAPQVGIIQFVEDVLQFDDAMSLSSAQQAQARANIGVGAPEMVNRLINPSGQIWQRVNSDAAAITDGTYAFDRWYGLTQSAGVTASQVANAENGTPYMMRLSQANATAQRFGIAQAIESGNIIDTRGRAVTLSARVRMSAATTLRYAIIEWTGTADAITKDVVNDWTSGTFTTGNFFISTTTTITATGSVALSANTLTSISLTGTVSGSMNNVIVFFWTDSTQAQNVTLDIGKVQLEVGSTATPLAFRAFQQELLLCQRYYEKTYPLGDVPGTAYGTGAGGGASGSYIYAASSYASLPTWSFKVEKRAAPSGLVYSPFTGASGKLRNSNGAVDVAALISTSTTSSIFCFVNNVAVSGTNFIYGHMVAIAEL